jgi:hypothetical protein
MTHKTIARKIYDALDEIDKSDVVRDKTVAIRVKELI